jgi:phage/plasmid-like protein (TIGR03299 family)
MTEEDFLADDIDFSTGDPAIAYVGKTPWHGFGAKLYEGQPVEVWLKEARLEWELKRLPVQYLVTGGLRTMDDRFVLLRSDNEEALSVVSGDYQVVQPKEVLEFYRDLVHHYGYKLETAGALNGGRKVWALAKTGIGDSVGENGEDGLAAYLLLATSCDKTLATTAAFTSVRVVCQNTLFFAVDDVKANRRLHVKVPHNLRFDAEQVKKDLGLMELAWSGFIKKVQKMVKRQLGADTTSRFFEELLRQSDSKPLSAKAEREKQTITALLTSAPGQQMATTKGTLWGAVNAVTYYADHVRPGADRLDSSWFGTGASLKDKAWTKAMDMVSTEN